MAFDPSQIRRYKSILNKLMSFKDGTEYENDYEFNQEQLLTITPIDIKRWMCLKAYGNPDPPAGSNPTDARGSSLMYYKKAISHFMPNKNNGWDEVILRGNPTKSREVLDLLKVVRKKEVRRQGAASMVRRPMEMEELRQIFEMCCNFDENDPKRYWLPSYIKYQFHLMARNDDVAHVTADCIMPNMQYDFTLKTRLRWSKNVNEERDAPEQIVMGGGDWKWCVQLGLALHLELWIGSGTGMVNERIFAGENDNADSAKDQAANLLREILQSDDFVKLKENQLGTHSIRKCSRTHCRCMGCSKDDCDHRGRWKSRKRIGDIYEDVILPYPDANVASALCIGGPIKYDFKQGNGVDDRWIRDHVVPNIAIRYDDAVCKVLGRALLWACFDAEASEYVPTSIKNHVVNEYLHLPVRFPEGENPMKKVRLVVNGAEDQVIITEVDGPDEESNGGGGAGHQVTRNEYLALFHEVRMLRSENRQLHETSNNRMSMMETQLSARLALVEGNIDRIARWPAQPRHHVNLNLPIGAAPPPPNDAALPHHTAQAAPANLTQQPRTLYILWQEWELGIGGRKAARSFTAEERGRVKHTFTRRKAAWDAISNLVRSGLTADRAIDRLYDHYGRDSTTTQIINRIRKDRAQYGGLHPNLR